jgi:hypothetical protein
MSNSRRAWPAAGTNDESSAQQNDGPCGGFPRPIFRGLGAGVLSLTLRRAGGAGTHPMQSKRALLMASVVIAFSAHALSSAAQQAPTGVATLNGGRNVMFLHSPVHLVAPTGSSDSKLVKIYSNLGKGSNVYDAVSGYGILGRDAGQMWPESVACGFRPKADHIVTELEVGLTYVQGTNIAVLSLNEDNHGLPGKALHSWKFKDLPDFGTCCGLQVAKVPKGIPVKKGKLYWVVVSPEQKFQDTYDVWNNDSDGEQGPFSNDIGSGWQQQSVQQLTNFGVFGK